MKSSVYFKTLYRSPLKTILTLLLLAVAAFLFLYNLEEYSVSDREYREARDKYEGVLTVEEQAVQDLKTPFDFFLLTDDTGRTDIYGKAFWDDFTPAYENTHQQSLGEELIDRLSTLPHVSRVEKRYLTAGVSPDYTRLDTDIHMTPFSARAVLTATVKSRYLSGVHNDEALMHRLYPDTSSVEFLIVENIELLAGDPAWLLDTGLQEKREEHAIELTIVRADHRGTADRVFSMDYSLIRCNMFTTENHVYPEDADIVQPGRRYLMILRNNAVDQGVATTTELQDEYPSAYYHLFNVGDDSLIGWWPYFVDITDLPENWLETDEFADLRELIRVTNDDVHTFDVVYGDDMAAQRRVAEGRMVCEDGRFITPADAGQPVCVVSTDFLEMSGLKIGDSITLDLGNYLSEQYAPLGAVAVTRGRQNTEYTRQEFTIIGSWRDLNEGNHVFRDRYWCWSNNAIFVPTSFLPECRNAVGHEFKPGEMSFVVGNAEEILPFMDKCLPILDEMGLSYVFSDGGWSAVGPDLMQARTIALVKLLVFGGAAVFALVMTVWLFIGRKKREYAIYRALGMPKRGASLRLYVPFLALGIVAAIIGSIAARVFSLRQMAAASAQAAEAGEKITVHTPAGSLLYVVGAAGFLLLLAMLAWFEILLIRRKSILELLGGDGGRQRKQALVPEAPSSGASRQLPSGEASRCGGTEDEGSALPSPALGGSRSRNWGGRYFRRLLGRNLGRSALSLLLAALLAFAFGLITVLRSIYVEAYRNVEVKPVFTGGISYERALKIADSGYVRDPYYEHSVQDGMVEMEEVSIILTNRLDHRVTEPVEWLEGWDEETAMNTKEKVLVLYSSHAEHLGISLGDKVRVNELDWWNKVSGMGMEPLKPGETDIDRRDKYRPFFQVVGVIQSERQEKTVFIPAEARNSLIFLVSNLQLDVAEYTLIDYHQAAAFSDYAKGQMDKNTAAVKFTMDTSYADRMYKIHRLIESLYPLAVAAALLLGGVLPGLIVLHGSREISILRALGVRARDCVILYTLSQVLCALAGLVLGIAAVLVALRPELGEVIVPFAIYLAAHLAACALGSGVFAWLCARKRVLEQLQSKE
jgi:ABC-type transport system, involved in lipoprotein release, permease component